MLTKDHSNNQEFVTIPSEDAMPLHATLWAADEPRAVMIIAHGVGEHGGCYADVATSIQASMPDLEILAVDFRGHGLSPGRRGYVDDYRDLIGDLRATLRRIGDRRPDLPIFLMGHSNGGQVALRLAIEEPNGIAGLVLSNPAVKLALHVPRWKLAVGRFLQRWAPRVTLTGSLNPELLTRDAAQWPDRLADTLRHSRISAPLFFGMVEGGKRLIGEAARLHVPLLLLLGTSDPIMDPGATLQLFENIGSSDKQIRLYPQSLHEPLNDLDRAQVIHDILAWLRERTIR